MPAEPHDDERDPGAPGIGAAHEPDPATPAVEPADGPEAGGPSGGRSRAASAASTLGGILVGFDEQVWRRQPPAQERVQEVDRANTVVIPGGLTIELPEPDGSGSDEP